MIALRLLCPNLGVTETVLLTFVTDKKGQQIPIVEDWIQENLDQFQTASTRKMLADIGLVDAPMRG